MHIVLAEESLTWLCSNTKSTTNAQHSPCLHAHNHIISNSAILSRDLYECVQVKKMVSQFEPPCETSSEKVMDWCTVQCKMLLFWFVQK